MFGVFIVLSAIAGLACSQSSSVMTSPATSPTRVQTWDDLGVSALRMIAELSRVCIVASRRDYRLDTSRPYTYLKYPSSYQATLTQATDVVDRAFRTTEMGISRMQMIMGLVPQELNTALTVLFQGTVADRQAFLPSTLQNIATKAKDVTSIIEKTSMELEQMANFFEEVLRAVQPTPPPSTTSGPTGATTTQANQASLDIDHATVLSNILAYAKSLITSWNEVTQLSNKLAFQADRAKQFMNERNTLLWALSDIDETANLLSTLASVYNEISMKTITTRTTSMASFIILQSEEERLAEVQKVYERDNHNVPLVQRRFAQAMVDHQTHNKERHEEYERLAAMPST